MQEQKLGYRSLRLRVPRDGDCVPKMDPEFSGSDPRSLGFPALGVLGSNRCKIYSTFDVYANKVSNKDCEVSTAAVLPSTDM